MDEIIRTIRSVCTVVAQFDWSTCETMIVGPNGQWRLIVQNPRQDMFQGLAPPEVRVVLYPPDGGTVIQGTSLDYVVDQVTQHHAVLDYILLTSPTSPTLSTEVQQEGECLPGVLLRSGCPIHTIHALHPLPWEYKRLTAVDYHTLANDVLHGNEAVTSLLASCAKGFLASSNDLPLITGCIILPTAVHFRVTIGKETFYLRRTSSMTSAHECMMSGRFHDTFIHTLKARVEDPKSLLACFDVYQQDSHVGSMVLSLHNVCYHAEFYQLINIESIVVATPGQGIGTQMFEICKEFLFANRRDNHSNDEKHGYVFSVCIDQEFFSKRLFENSIANGFAFQLHCINAYTCKYTGNVSARCARVREAIPSMRAI